MAHKSQAAPSTDIISEPEPEPKLIKSLKDQIEKLHRDLKTANTQLSNARNQKTKAAEEHKAEIEKLKAHHGKQIITTANKLNDSSHLMKKLTDAVDEGTRRGLDLEKKVYLFEEFNSELQVEF